MRFDVVGHGLSIDPPGDLRCVAPDHEPEIQRRFGVTLRSDAHEVEVQVRAIEPASCALDARGMTDLVRRQQWRPPGFDPESGAAGALTWAAMTWDGDPFVVRECFVTDGRRVANVALVGRTRAAVAGATPLVEALIEGLRLAADRGDGG